MKKVFNIPDNNFGVAEMKWFSFGGWITTLDIIINGNVQFNTLLPIQRVTPGEPMLFDIFVHELGHSMGLSHLKNYGGRVMMQYLSGSKSLNGCSFDPSMRPCYPNLAEISMILKNIDRVHQEDWFLE